MNICILLSKDCNSILQGFEQRRKKWVLPFVHFVAVKVANFVHRGSCPGWYKRLDA